MINVNEARKLSEDSICFTKELKVIDNLINKAGHNGLFSIEYRGSPLSAADYNKDISYKTSKLIEKVEEFGFTVGLVGGKDIGQDIFIRISW